MVSYHIEDGMHLCKFHRRNLWGLQPLTCIFASENGAFGCCGYWICDALELLLMQAISGRSDCCFAAVMVWECLAISKVVSLFSARIRWLQISFLAC